MRSKRAVIVCALLSVCLFVWLSGCKEQKTVSEAPVPAPPSAAAEISEPDNKIEVSEMERRVMDTENILLPDMSFSLPQDSSSFSPELAMQLLVLCSGQTQELTRAAFDAAGFETVIQRNYDKESEDPSHTCAWSLGRKDIQTPFGVQPVFLISVRGTNAGEWYSNFDFAVSRSNETCFAENFLFCAEDVLLAVQETLSECDNPVIIVCGHSRGAACANLLGVLLDDIYPEQNVFVYTFATPTTVRKAAAERDYPNIFNVVNMCDIVPRLPLAAWGYERAGTDIVLGVDDEYSANISDAIDSLYLLAPDIEAYYENKHSLTGAGLSEDGLTAFEMMLAIAKTLTGLDGTDIKADKDYIGAFSVSEESDFDTLFNLIENAAENYGEGAYELLIQHLPTTYMSLLQAY